MVEQAARANRSGIASEQAAVAERTQRLLEAVRDVTLEEFHSEDAHFERDSRLGRELLYLVANNAWCRRTTEVVDASHAQAIDTDVIVDVDLTYADHEAFELDAGITWLPLLALPSMQAAAPIPSGDPLPRLRRRPWTTSIPRDRFSREDPDPISGLEVSDGSGDRVHRLPQAEVRQRLAAALAEMILNVMARRSQQANPESGEAMHRHHKLILSAAIRRLLPGIGERPVGHGGTVPTGIRKAREQLEKEFGEDVRLARAAAAEVRDDNVDARTARASSAPKGIDPYDDAARRGADDAHDESWRQLKPVLGSHVGEILNALIGTTFVVVAVADPGHPISYTVHVPSRRLIRQGRAWFQPRALLSIDLLAPTAHADRQIRLTLPDGVICHDGSAGAVGRIDVVLPAPFERLEALMRRLFPPNMPSGRAASWVDSRIAEMALHKVDAALDSLRHYTVTETRSAEPRGGDTEASFSSGRRRRDAPSDTWQGVAAPGNQSASVQEWAKAGPRRKYGTMSAPEQTESELTAIVDRQLVRLREELAKVRASYGQGLRMDTLHSYWDDGAWFPERMRRRLVVNTASANLVMLRAPAVDDVSLRARPVFARIEADVSVFDSEVFNVARYAGALNMTVLTVLTLLLILKPPGDGNATELLATILTLFSAVQASRAQHPDGSTLRGLLSRANYWIMLGSVLPTVLLAMALAVLSLHQAVWAAVVALIVQGALTLRLRRGPLFRWRQRPPTLILATGHPPDHARVDVLRGRRSRALVTEALLLGREAHAYVVTRPAGQDQFLGLLERTQSGSNRVEERIGRMTARAAKLLSARGVELPASAAAAQLAINGPAPAANLLGVVQSATAGRAMTYLVFRDRPSNTWLANGADQEDSVSTVPLDPDRLAPMEPPEWQLEVLIGIPESSVAIALASHPLMRVVTATQRYNFQVTSVQLPAPPPPGGAGRRWMRLRVGVSYRSGDSLRGVGSFLYRLHQMDKEPFGDGTLSVIVRVNADRQGMPGLASSRPLSDRDFDVVPDEEAASDPHPNWRTLAITAHSRIGLLHDVLGGLAKDAPTFELAGLTVAAVYGQTVMFMVGRDRSPEARDGAVRRTLARRVRPSDRLIVAVDQRLTAKTLDGAAGLEDRLLLRVGLRTPDRTGVLRETLRDLSKVLTEHSPHGVKVNGLDVWFVLLEVVNGRTTRGRLTIRLPGSPADWPLWTNVDWAAVERSLGRAAALAARADGNDLRSAGWWAPVLDDTVITTELLRTTAPPPLA